MAALQKHQRITGSNSPVVDLADPCRVVFALFAFAIIGTAQETSPKNTTGYVDVAGGHIYYEECGSASTIVLLHDGLLHSVVWEDMWPCARSIMLCVTIAAVMANPKRPRPSFRR
jgi:hypothetical protein